jgi:predicted RNA-binding Zn ribbon-like protein
MNALLARQPIHPVIVYHDEPRWHVHLTESGSVADRYAAGAVIGLTLLVAQHGIRRLGCCAIASCSGVFLDASPNGSRRYCAEHSATRSNVTAIRSEHGNSGAGGADAAAS